MMSGILAFAGPPAAASSNSTVLSGVTVTPPASNTAGSTVGYALDLQYTSAPTSGESIAAAFPFGFSLASASVTGVTYANAGATGKTTATLYASATTQSSGVIVLGKVPGSVTGQAYSFTLDLQGVVNSTTAAPSYTVTASDPTSAPGVSSQGFAVIAGPATQLAVSPSKQTATASKTPSAPMQVTLADQYGNAVAAPSAGLVVGLTSSPTGVLFASSASSAGKTITQVTIPGGQSSASFVAGSPMAQQYIVTAQPPSSSTLSAGSATLTVGAAAAYQVALTGPATVQPTAASGPYTIQVEDQFGNPAPVAAAVSVSLSDLLGGTFYGYDAAKKACGTSAVKSVSVAASASTAQFCFSAPSAGSDTLTGTVPSSSGLKQLTATLQVTVGVPPVISFAQSKLQTTAAVVIKQRVPVWVTLPSSNVVGSSVGLAAVRKSGVAVGDFYATATSSTPIQALNVTAADLGVPQEVFYAEDTTAGAPPTNPVTLTAKNVGLASAPLTLTVNPAPAQQLALSLTNGGSVTAGTVGGTATVTLENQYGEPLPPSGASGVSVSLSSSPSGLTFGTSSTPVTAETVPSGKTSVTFGVYGVSTNGGAPYTITAVASGYSSASAEATVVAAKPAAQLSVTLGPGQPVDVNGQSVGEFQYPVTVIAEDANGNPVAPTQATEVALSNTAGGFFYRQQYAGYASTNPAISQVALGPITGGTVDQVQVWYVEPASASGTTTLSASATALTTGSASLVDPTGISLVVGCYNHSGVVAPCGVPGGSYSNTPLLLTRLTGPSTATEQIHPFPAAQVIDLTSSVSKSTFESGGSTVTSETVPAGQLFTTVVWNIPSGTPSGTVTATPTDTSLAAVSLTINVAPQLPPHTVTVSLQPGWNTLSIPFVVNSPSFASILSDGGKSMTVAYAYDTAKSSWVQVTSSNEATILSTPMTALYVQIGGTNSVTATLEPTSAPNAPPTYALATGWNLVGPSALQLQNSYSEFLFGVTPSVVPVLVDPNGTAYGGGRATTDPVAETSSYVFNGSGYWVYATGPATLIGHIPTGQVSFD